MFFISEREEKGKGEKKGRKSPPVSSDTKDSHVKFGEKSRTDPIDKGE